MLGLGCRLDHCRVVFPSNWTVTPEFFRDTVLLCPSGVTELLCRSKQKLLNFIASQICNCKPAFYYFILFYLCNLMLLYCSLITAYIMPCCFLQVLMTTFKELICGIIRWLFDAFTVISYVMTDSIYNSAMTKKPSDYLWYL